MGRRFDTTRWSVVLAVQEGSTCGAQEALASLCEAYWEPLYAYCRRQGYGVEEARDLTQGYFTQLLEKDYLAEVHPSKGRLRSFLLASLKHFLANERDRAWALKRGGGSPEISLDTDTAESRYRVEAVDDLTPDKVFEKRWALTVIARVLARLREESTKTGKQKQFEQLKVFLTGEGPRLPYKEVGDELGMNEGAVKTAVHRLRRHFGQLLRDEIAETVANDSEVDAEIRHLLSALG